MKKELMSSTIIIVDDNKMIRDAWKSLISLHDEYEVVADVSNGNEAIEVLKTTKADIMLMDISMPEMDGIEATSIISKIPGAPKIIALSMHRETVYVRKMIAAGAKGYVDKDCSPLELFIAIDEILDDSKYFSFRIRLDNKLLEMEASTH